MTDVPPTLQPTRCAICDTTGNADERWPATFDMSAFSREVFSARRLPDQVHYRMVTCRLCGLVRSDPVLDAGRLAELYRESTFDYGDELDALKATYGRAIDGLAVRTGSRDALLDIGCGNGFVLDEALRRGWADARGVEPSADAISKAAPGTGERITHDIMRGGLFAPASFDAVTLFQVLDHIPEPVPLLEECRRVLRPGGGILAFNHDVASWSARLLGRRSPIVDIEHTYLYSPVTMRRLFERAGFTDIEVGPVRNTYSIRYLAQLVPLPDGMKAQMLRSLRDRPGGRRTVTLPLGNLCLMARPRR